jgi:hypothetical protein
MVGRALLAAAVIAGTCALASSSAIVSDLFSEKSGENGVISLAVYTIAAATWRTYDSQSAFYEVSSHIDKYRTDTEDILQFFKACLSDAQGFDSERKVCYEKRSENFIRSTKTCIDGIVKNKREELHEKAEEAYASSTSMLRYTGGSLALNVAYGWYWGTQTTCLVQPQICAAFVFMGLFVTLADGHSGYVYEQTAEKIGLEIMDKMHTYLNHYIDREAKEKLCTEKKYLNWKSAKVWDSFCHPL